MSQRPMPTRRIARATGAFVLAAMLGGCGLTGEAAEEGPYARLGPPTAPVRLHYEEHGTGSPILLLHGFGANTYTWRYIAPALARNHTVIAVDLKGFGQSDKPFDERYSALDQAELLTELILDRDLHHL